MKKSELIKLIESITKRVLNEFKVDNSDVVIQFKKYKCRIEKMKYSNGRIALKLTDVNDGSPVAVASVNLVDEDLANNEIAIKNHSENEGMLDVLVKANLVSKPIRYVQSGYVVIPICKLL
jgi:hypothetical protein